MRDFAKLRSFVIDGVMTQMEAAVKGHIDEGQ